MICCVNGDFIPSEHATVSIFDHGFLFSDGFYDTLKAFDGRILDIDSHMERTAASLHLVNITLPWPLTMVRTWIEKTARLNPMALARIRMTITRGVNHFDFNSSQLPTLVITAEPIIYESHIYTGVSVITTRLSRTLPEVKTLGVTSMILARRHLATKHAFEVLFLDESGFVHEGSISNIFYVKDGNVCTPRNNILKGITRKEIIQIYHARGVNVIERDVSLTELAEADEIFLTNTKSAVVPVLALNGIPIADGTVGPITYEVMAAFEDFTTRSLAALG